MLLHVGGASNVYDNSAQPKSLPAKGVEPSNTCMKG